MSEIDKDVPVPDRKKERRPIMYPWETLAVGESFLVPTDTVRPHSVQAATSKANRIYPDRHFITRAVDGGTRVWRIARSQAREDGDTGRSSIFKFDKDVRVPALDRAGHAIKYPWEELAVGESFLVPTDTVKERSVWAAVRRANGTYTDRRFTSRVMDGGVRVWCIA